jgi:hypothetical protein
MGIFHSTELIITVDNLRVHLLAKIGMGSRMAFLSKQFDARITGRVTLILYSRAAIGDQYRILTQKAKPQKKSPRGNEGCLSYLARLVELMITDDLKEFRHAAVHLGETQANEVAIAQELPVISEENTSS